MSDHGASDFMSTLFFIFLTLKLTGYLDWSWWAVTAPMWGMFLLVCLVGILYLAMGEG